MNRFQPDTDHDRWVQAALTIQGKIGNYDLTYSGGYFNRCAGHSIDYTDYSVAYDAAFGSGAFWQDANGNPLPHPSKRSSAATASKRAATNFASPRRPPTVSVSSPACSRSVQTHWIIQDYVIQGFGPQISVPGWPNTIWLTDQNRIDRDEAAFGEASFDITPQADDHRRHSLLPLRQHAVGFYGFGEGYDALTGYLAPARASGDVELHPGPGLPQRALRQPRQAGVGSTGETHKVNLTYKFDADDLVYFTYSTGYGPGGVNRSGAFPPYTADSLDQLRDRLEDRLVRSSLYFDGALYDEEFNKFQFAFLGPNSLTIIANAPSAQDPGRRDQHRLARHPAADALRRRELQPRGADREFLRHRPGDGTFIPTCPRQPGAGRCRASNCPTRRSSRATSPPATPSRSWAGTATCRPRCSIRRWLSPPCAPPTMPTWAPCRATPPPTSRSGAERNNLTLDLFLKNAFDSRGEVNRYTPCTISICAPAYPAWRIPPAAVYVVADPAAHGRHQDRPEVLAGRKVAPLC